MVLHKYKLDCISIFMKGKNSRKKLLAFSYMVSCSKGCVLQLRMTQCKYLEGERGKDLQGKREECGAPPWGLDSALYFLTSTQCTELQQSLWVVS